MQVVGLQVSLRCDQTYFGPQDGAMISQPEAKPRPSPFDQSSVMATISIVAMLLWPTYCGPTVQYNCKV